MERGFASEGRIKLTSLLELREEVGGMNKGKSISKRLNLLIMASFDMMRRYFNDCCRELFFSQGRWGCAAYLISNSFQSDLFSPKSDDYMGIIPSSGLIRNSS